MYSTRLDVICRFVVGSYSSSSIWLLAADPAAAGHFDLNISTASLMQSLAAAAGRCARSNR